MKAFEIRVGQGQRLLKFQPQDKVNQFKIYAADKAEDWIDYEQSRSVDVPQDGLLVLLQYIAIIISILMGRALSPARIY